MSLADVESILGPARIEAGTRCLPLYPPLAGGLVLMNDGPLTKDHSWASGDVAVTVRVNNRTKRVEQVWVSLPK